MNVLDGDVMPIGEFDARSIAQDFGNLDRGSSLNLGIILPLQLDAFDGLQPIADAHRQTALAIHLERIRRDSRPEDAAINNEEPRAPFILEGVKTVTRPQAEFGHIPVQDRKLTIVKGISMLGVVRL